MMRLVDTMNEILVADRDPVRELADRVAAVREAARVERCHAVPHVGSYSNGAHTYGVLCLARLLWPREFPLIVDVILFHDIPERWTGDVPAQVMRTQPAVREGVNLMERRISQLLRLPSEHEMDPALRIIFKACDRLELYLWCREQLRMGNREVIGVMEQLDQVWEREPLPEPALSLYQFVKKEGWKRQPEVLEGV